MPVRKPGNYWTDLTDEELLAAPPRMLSVGQRRRRRQLRTQKKSAEIKEANIARRNGTAARLKQCMGYKRDGSPCTFPAMNGVKHCRLHLNDAERVKLDIPKPGKKKYTGRIHAKDKVTGPQLMREVSETAVEKLVHRYFLALGLEFLGFDEVGNPIVIDKGVTKGICLHGESKDGYVHMSQYPDLVAQVGVMEKLFDRVYGKAKQTQVLEGGVKPVQIEPVRTVERSQQMAEMLRRSGALPPAQPPIEIEPNPAKNGAQEGAPSEPHYEEPKQENASKIVQGKSPDVPTIPYRGSRRIEGK